MKSWLCCLLLLLAGMVAAPVQAREAPLPKDPDKFTAFMADPPPPPPRFGEADPAAKVKVIGPLRLDLTSVGHTIYLDNIWRACDQDRRRCRKAVAQFVTDMTASIKEQAGDVKTTDIRAVVRTIEYAQEATEVAAGKPERKPVIRRVAGALWMVCVVDSPHGVKILQHADLTKLGLTDEQAIALALKNTAAALRPLAADTHVVKQYGLKFAAGDFYESSRMLLHDSWRDLSKEMGGHLIVAVPSNDFLIYGNGSGDRTPLAAFARMIVDKAQKPMTPTLFEWTETGWEIVKP